MPEIKVAYGDRLLVDDDYKNNNGGIRINKRWYVARGLVQCADQDRTDAMLELGATPIAVSMKLFTVWNVMDRERTEAKRSWYYVASTWTGRSEAIRRAVNHVLCNAYNMVADVRAELGLINEDHYYLKDNGQRIIQPAEGFLNGIRQYIDEIKRKEEQDELMQSKQYERWLEEKQQEEDDMMVDYHDPGIPVPGS